MTVATFKKDEMDKNWIVWTSLFCLNLPLCMIRQEVLDSTFSRRSDYNTKYVRHTLLKNSPIKNQDPDCCDEILKTPQNNQKGNHR